MNTNEKFEAAISKAKLISEQNPDITSLWIEINDCPLSELRELSEKLGIKLEFSKAYEKMRLDYPASFNYSFVIWLYSAKVEIQEHIVVTEAIINV